MALTPGQLAYWRNRTGNPRLTAREAERLRQGPQGSLQPYTDGGRAALAPPGQIGPPAPTGPPLDPTYDASVGNINRRRDDTLAYLGNEETRVRQDFGIDDTSNPFSRARLLERNFQQRQTGNTNSYAARGQLYSGALQNQRNETQFQFTQGQDSLRRSFNDVMGDINRRRTLAQSGSEEELIAAGDDRISRAIANRPDPSTFAGGELFSDDGGIRQIPTTPRRRRRRRR